VAVETLDGLPASQEDYVQSIMLEAGRRGLRTTKLIQSTGPRGIVRCNEPELERLIDLINGTPARPAVRSFHTLRTSGTLRTIRERYFPELEGGRAGKLR
jgi:RNase P/RNase MRP subunit POP5